MMQRELCKTERNEGASAPDRLLQFLERLERDRFFGKVTIAYQSGRAVDLRVEQVHKLNEL